MVLPGSSRRRLALAVAAASVFALVVRFLQLGERTFHWDEARVGYWILQYQVTGEWQYRAIVHGPFLFHVNEFLFGIFGASDAVARWPVALVGGLFPATAWLFRTRLDDVEVGAMAALLALNPVLIYYSRFMRNDVLVGAFSLAALGFAVRAMDTERGEYLVAAGAFMGLAFTTKENALVYLGMFVGATALLLDERLFTARVRGTDWDAEIRRYVRWAARGLFAWRRAVGGAVVAFLAVVLLFYTPRCTPAAPGCYTVLEAPARVPGVLVSSLFGAWNEFWGTWGVGGVSRKHSYVQFLRDALRTLGATSLMLSAAAVLGFLVERYVADEPRDLVLFAAYWAAASVVVYPAVTDISGHWSVVHAVVPMAIPAAVGARLVVERGLSAFETDDRVGVALAALVLVAAVGQMGVVATETSFIMPQDGDNELVQFGQPGSDLSAPMARIDSVAATNDGTDVLYYGSHFSVSSEENPRHPEAAKGDWYNRLPLPWYLELADAEADSAVRLSAVNETDAPVVIARAKHYTDIASILYERGYTSKTYALTTPNTAILVFVDESAT
jgi:uncharacterized protein (TIGR03663 family)